MKSVENDMVNLQYGHTHKGLVDTIKKISGKQTLNNT